MSDVVNIDHISNMISIIEVPKMVSTVYGALADPVISLTVL